MPDLFRTKVVATAVDIKEDIRISKATRADFKEDLKAGPIMVIVLTPFAHKVVEVSSNSPLPECSTKVVVPSKATGMAETVIGRPQAQRQKSEE